MSKWVDSSVLDSLLDKVATSTIISVCSKQPTTRAEATTTDALAMTPISGVDFTKSNGDTSGRKTTVIGKSNLDVIKSGTANHIALCDNTNLLFVTTCVPQVVTGGNKINIPSWKIEVSSPS